MTVAELKRRVAATDTLTITNLFMPDGHVLRGPMPREVVRTSGSSFSLRLPDNHENAGDDSRIGWPKAAELTVNGTDVHIERHGRPFLIVHDLAA